MRRVTSYPGTGLRPGKCLLWGLAIVGLSLMGAGSLWGQSGNTDPRLTPAAPLVEPQKPANSSANQKKSRPKAGDAAKAAPVSKARIEELLGFVDQHHRELRPLLSSLQRNRPQQFQNAMRSLDREVQALQDLEERSPQRYRRSLKQWVNRSRTKLLAAQLVVQKSDQDSARIRHQMAKLINEYYDLRAEQLREDITSLNQRSERLQQQLDQQQRERSAEVQRQIDVLTRYAKGLQSASEKSNPDAGKLPAATEAPEKKKKKE